MEPARRCATYEDLAQVPDHMVAEVVDGELYATPRPASPHARVVSVMGRDLGDPFDRPADGPGAPGGWWILFEPELHFGDDIVVPDLAGWRRGRMPRIPNVAFFEQAPDWACEVVSPTTGALDRVRKMRIYSREHIAHLWLVDALAKTLEVYRLEAGRWIVVATHAGSERVRAEPFDAVELELARWWLEP
jgi:Uma2 family endonuclease